MHYLVKMLVQADTAEEAVEQAYRDGETMVERGDADWFDMDGRWGKSKAYKITSKKGKELLKEGMECNRSEFDRAMSAIRYMMENYSDDDIYNETFTKKEQHDSEYYLSKYQFTIAAGSSNAAAVYAMDGNLWGSRIDSDRELEMLLADKDKTKLWVVPVDVHN